MSAISPNPDLYQTRLSQFYETLKLSAALGQKSLAKRSRLSSDPPNEVNTQRRFLKNLAFICDHRKDDSEKTSIAVESDGDLSRFWVAVDHQPETDVAHGLVSILTVLKRILDLPAHLQHHGGDVFQSTCAASAKARLHPEIQNLCIAVKDCQVVLEQLNIPELQDLPEWLNQFNSEVNPDRNILAWCRLAYEAQDDDAMGQLSSIVGSSDYRSLTLPFSQMRYSIRHLASQVQAGQEIIEDGGKLKSLLNRFHVRMIKPTESVPPPTLDPHMDFGVIVKRLVDAKHPLENKIDAAFLRMKESNPDIEERFKRQYGEGMAVPRVQSEVQMLEHFYKRNLKYSMGDKFIGISKPCCLCSQSYFQHHLAACVGPETNGKLCQSWGPPLVPDGRFGEDFIPQNKLMKKVHDDVRQRVLQRILQIDQMGVHPKPACEDADSGPAARLDLTGSEAERISSDDWYHVAYGSDRQGSN